MGTVAARCGTSTVAPSAPDPVAYACPTVIAVNAVVRRNDGILLVLQQGPDDSEPSWFLPGGIVEAGETIDQGLRRELQEETGLVANAIGPLLWMAQILDPVGERQTLAYAFQVDDISGELHPSDPDEYILEARFLRIDEAAKALETAPTPAMRQPPIAYLQGIAPPATTWIFHRQPDGSQELVARYP